MDYISGWCKSKRRLDGITMIVTGSNTGVGKETALDFYRRGARVIMACRNISTAKDAKQAIEENTKEEEGTGTLVIEKLDLCSLKSVREFAGRMTSYGNLKVLVCNAGVMMCPESRTEDGFETHIGSNHLAHALLALLLLPTLIKNGSSRIVFVSSRLHQFYRMNLDDMNFEITKYNSVQAYANSKIANILFTKALHNKLREHNIINVNTYSLHPGIVKTEIGRHFPQTAWRIITYGFQNYLLQWCWKSPKCGAQTSIYCAIDEKCENESGFYYSDCAKAWCSWQCQNEKEAQKLWDVTIDMLNLHDYDPFSQDPTNLSSNEQ